MTPEHDKKLCDDFPEIFRDRNADMKTTCMCWGFECGDGWFQLIYDLCDKLNKLPDVPYATQVKEKFGTLRFYIYNGSHAAFDLIADAEELSGYTCEVCGEPGNIRGAFWYQTLCDKHAKGYTG